MRTRQPAGPPLRGSARRTQASRGPRLLSLPPKEVYHYAFHIWNRTSIVPYMESTLSTVWPARRPGGTSGTLPANRLIVDNARSARGQARDSWEAKMIIDIHGHYTAAPTAHQEFRDAQLARLIAPSLADPNHHGPSLPQPAPARISDDQVRESIEGNQLRIARERGTDLTVF